MIPASPAQLEAEFLHFGHLTLLCDPPEVAAALVALYAARIEAAA